MKMNLVIVIFIFSLGLISCQYLAPAGIIPTDVPDILLPLAAATPEVSATSSLSPTVAASNTGTSVGTASSPPSIDLAAHTLPAESSVEFKLAAAQIPQAKRYTFRIQDLPAGVTTEFLGNPIPWENTLVLRTPGSLAPGRYVANVVVNSDTLPSAPAQITLDVIPCSEFQPGEFTESIRSRLVELLTAGKPGVGHGLLVPLQACGGARTTHLKVTLEAVKSEAGANISIPPRFYLYRSLVWPAPNSIQANPGADWSRNVALPRIDSAGWQLEGDLTPGLYLLVFERDRFGAAADPKAVPGTVTFRLEKK